MEETQQHYPVGSQRQQQPAASNQSDQPEQQLKTQKRKVCARCSRPERVCLCASLPDSPIGILGTVVVLQHPHELKKALATVPLLKQTLQHFHILVGRKLRESLNPHVRALLDATQAATQPEGGQHSPASSCSSMPPLYVLFPGENAKPVDEVAMSAPHLERLRAAHEQQRMEQQLQQQQRQQSQPQQCAGQHQSQQDQLHPVYCAASPAYVLLVVDGTWQQAKEMFNALKPDLLPPSGRGLQVCLPPDQPLRPSEQPLPSTNQPQPPTEQTLPPEQPLQPPQLPQSHDDKAEDKEGAHNTESDQVQETDCRREEKAANVAARLAVDAQNRHAGLLRKEPVEGYMTTYEAICRAVAALEGSMHACAHPGLEERILTSPLPEVQQQLQQCKGHQPRQQQEQQQQQHEVQHNLEPQPQEQQQQQRRQQESTVNPPAPSADALAQAKQHESSLLARLLAPLQLMAAYQARWDPCTRDRIQGKLEAQSEWATERGRILVPKQQKKQKGNSQPSKTKT